MWETLGSVDASKSMLKATFEMKSSNEELLQHYYSQVSKDDIRKLAHKYQTDMELFGYDPEYFIQMGSGE